MNKPTAGGLCSGIGGFELGLQQAGFEISWSVEKDDFCRRLMQKNFSNASHYGDIRDVGKRNLHPVDLVVAGFPCQPFSIAGRQGGSSDDRYLWPEIIRNVSEIRPAWVLLENVPDISYMVFPSGELIVESRQVTRFGDRDEYKAIFTQEGLVYLELFCQDLEKIGYQVESLVIPVAAIGAPHLRYRVWIVACNESVKWSHGKVEKPKEYKGPSGKNRGLRSALPNTNGRLSLQPEGEVRPRGNTPTSGSKAVANTNREREQQHSRIGTEERQRIKHGSEALPHPHGDDEFGGSIDEQVGWIGESKKTLEDGLQRGTEWLSESRVGRATDGFSAWLDGPFGPGWEDGIPRITNEKILHRQQRLKALGNAVCPPLVKKLGEFIIASMEE